MGVISASAEELAAPLEVLPPVEFCCAYGSSLLHSNPTQNKGVMPMVDYILGVSDPVQWHYENLERNRNHYASWMACLGAKAITQVADNIGVGVHFNPFVPWNDKKIKYGVVRMHDLVCDVLSWNRFYLSGRLQKPVSVLVDNFGIGKVNRVNLKAAAIAALLLLPPDFAEEDLYSTICSLSYMGDVRMFLAEDRHKVKKIVQGSFSSFQAMYRPLTRELCMEGFLESSCQSNKEFFKQDCGPSATHSLFSSLPSTIVCKAALDEEGDHKFLQMMRSLSGSQKQTESNAMPPQVKSFSANSFSREEAAHLTRRALRRLVMVSSTRQLASGLLAAGGVNAVRYVGRKMSKAWGSRTS